MRIGINMLFHANGGSYRNLLQLLREWHDGGVFGSHEVVCFSSRHTHERLREDGASTLPAEVVVYDRADQGLAMRIAVEQRTLPVEMENRRLDVLYCPANTVPFRGAVRRVVTFQNIAPFAAQIGPRTVGLRRWMRFKMLGKFMEKSARVADQIIFGSKHFRDVFVERTGLDAAKTQVIYRARTRPPSSIDQNLELERSLGIQRPYILCVSHLYPYKNILQLIHGYVEARNRWNVKGKQLVIAGGVILFPEYHSRVTALVRQLQLNENDVLLTGHLAHQEIRPLLAGCDVFAFPSTCENCPTSLIEALSMGKPVCCSNVGVMPEVAGDAAVYFDPFKSQEIGRALSQVTQDASLKRMLSERALAQSQRFPSEAAMARQTLDVITGGSNVSHAVKRVA